MRGDAEITELDIDILRAVAAGHLPGARLLTVELRRLVSLGLLDLAGTGRSGIRITARGGHAIEVANGECTAG